jgi:hypothetical protein
MSSRQEMTEAQVTSMNNAIHAHSAFLRVIGEVLLMLRDKGWTDVSRIDSILQIAT